MSAAWGPLKAGRVEVNGQRLARRLDVGKIGWGVGSRGLSLVSYDSGLAYVLNASKLLGHKTHIALLMLVTVLRLSLE